VTPVRVGGRTIVVAAEFGDGRGALGKRFGSESIVLFRRGRAEMRRGSRRLSTPRGGRSVPLSGGAGGIVRDEQGNVREMECIRMELARQTRRAAGAGAGGGSEFRIRWTP